MIDLQQTIIIKIGEEQITITYPKNGQFDDIEIKKQMFSNGMYDSLKRSSEVDKRAKFSLDSIDMKSTLIVLVPDLNKKLNINSIFDLDREQTIKLIKQYKIVDEWLTSWEKAFEEASKENE